MSFALRHAADLQGEGDILANREPGEQRIVLPATAGPAWPS